MHVEQAYVAHPVPAVGRSASGGDDKSHRASTSMNLSRTRTFSASASKQDEQMLRQRFKTTERNGASGSMWKLTGSLARNGLLRCGASGVTGESAIARDDRPSENGPDPSSASRSVSHALTLCAGQPMRLSLIFKGAGNVLSSAKRPVRRWAYL